MCIVSSAEANAHFINQFYQPFPLLKIWKVPIIKAEVQVMIGYIKLESITNYQNSCRWPCVDGWIGRQMTVASLGKPANKCRVTKEGDDQRVGLSQEEVTALRLARPPDEYPPPPPHIGPPHPSKQGAERSSLSAVSRVKQYGILDWWISMKCRFRCQFIDSFNQIWIHEIRMKQRNCCFFYHYKGSKNADIIKKQWTRRSTPDYRSE